MAVNAQSILETIHENAQKNVLTNKVKRAAVPGLSMFGILWYSLVFFGIPPVEATSPTVPTPIMPPPK